MRSAIRSGRELYHRLGLEAQWTSEFKSVENDFPVFVPREFLAKIRPGDLDDPLLRQVLPIAEELVHSPGFSRDPVGDAAAQRATGLLKKYAGRALLVTTGACAVHCRYCFRRHYPYAVSTLNGRERAEVIRSLCGDDTIEEVLLSGGDPLTLSDPFLADLIDELSAIDHLRRLRIHTRVPIMIPSRITDSLVQMLSTGRLATWFVIHVNHPRELDQATLAGLNRLVQAGVPVLNQSVLLRGVNDSAEVLVELCRTLVNHRITPYYLHQLDRVAGAAHFEVPTDEGQRLMEQIRQVLPGYAVPRYVCEVAGRPYKEVIA